MLPKIPRQADPLKGSIERPLRHQGICEGKQDVMGYALPLRQIHHLHFPVVHGVAKEKNGEIRVLRILVHPSAGQIYGTVGFDVDGQLFHLYSLAFRFTG